jgi:hypothetical protein
LYVRNEVYKFTHTLLFFLKEGKAEEKKNKDTSSDNEKSLPPRNKTTMKRTTAKRTMAKRTTVKRTKTTTTKTTKKNLRPLIRPPKRSRAKSKKTVEDLEEKFKKASLAPTKNKKSYCEGGLFYVTYEFTTETHQNMLRVDILVPPLD